MAESSLSIGFPDLKEEVAAYLGYGRDSSKWSTSQENEIESYVQSGVRQFYFPPAVSSMVDDSFEWSFMRPTKTIDTVVDQWEYDLPDDFGRIIGDLYFDPEETTHPIVVIGYGMLLAERARSDDSGVPKFAATRWKTSDGSGGQRQELLLHAPPDAVYTLTYRYEAFSGKLTDANPYPLGGMKHSEALISSCLAVAEQRANGERDGVQWQMFTRNLATSIQRDRKTGARYFGQMASQSDATAPVFRRQFGSNYEITYKGETW